MNQDAIPPLVYELSGPGRSGTFLPKAEAGKSVQDLLPSRLLRRDPAALPSLPEAEAIRHYVRLSTRNYGVDTGMYPLGSCTMKYNPKINEQLARREAFLNAHPYQDDDAVQGILAILHELADALKAIGGMSGVTLQPAAGAHGELTGILMCRAYHTANGNPRSRILVPDSSHGTNPATASMCGYRVVSIPSTSRGTVDIERLRQEADTTVAALMITNPNTFGVFENDIEEAARIVHGCGGLMYYDGANMNAIMGYTTPAAMGFDLVHFNLHKTFGTPHGTGGPGAGPVGVRDSLVPFLPYPTLGRSSAGTYFMDDTNRHTSIGKVRCFWGNFLVLLKALLYIRAHGGTGLKDVSGRAVLNACYLRKKLEALFDMPIPTDTLHEFVLSAARLKREQNVSALDIAKRILDYGFHPPTVYFPLVVKEAMMVEPTETETRENLDHFALALAQIVEEATRSPDKLRRAPLTTPVTRPDEVRANRKPILRARTLLRTLPNRIDGNAGTD